MGQAMKKMAAPFKGWSGETEPEQSKSDLSKLAVAPFVFKRRGSQYFDEDGHLAHEFYEQTVDSTTKTIRMQRCSGRKLVPQGEVQLKVPRINSDLPIILFEASETYHKHR